MLNARKLAAIDRVFLGPKLVITEFIAGVFLSAALGIFVLVAGHGSPVQIGLGLYFISLGTNYIPLRIFAIAMTKANSARSELGRELDNTRLAT